MNPHKLTRRRVIAAGIAGTAAMFWPGAAPAQGNPVLSAPKRALVIGNARYRDAPLRNPVNDAQGMAAALEATGFEVDLGLDLTQAQMRQAIAAYVEGLVKARAVGLFYFAGHGVQLAWRNYLVPVDAQIEHIDEVRSRTIDVNSVIDGIRTAGNPMNLIILDACRDNPFGTQTNVGQRGLSQLDAPPGTLLAYATAPGHTAADGDGANGLYTGNLLREIKVPETKVEDIFKRVRLSVRRRSNGQQIPWESTSLEQDFWFIPPSEVRKLAEEEAEREFAQELALWQKIQGAQEPVPFEDYLRRYPSGRFSELAQLRLDQILARAGEKKVEAVPAPQNPYSKGSVRADTAYRVGDRYVYRLSDLLTGLEEGRPRFVVTGITDTEVIYNNGRSTEDLLGNELRMRSGVVWGPNQIAPLEFAVGRRWSTRFDIITEKQRSAVVELDLRITAREPLTVPAGTFEAFRVEGSGWARGEKLNAQWELKRWYAPDRVRRWIKWEFLVRGPKKIGRARNFELVSFSQS